MQQTFHLEIITPTKVLDKGQVEYLRAPSTDGLFGIMKGHTKGIIALDIGELKIICGGKKSFLATSGGYVEISNNKVQILAETIEHSDEIDTDRAKESEGRALERIEDKKMSNTRTRLALDRAKNRIRVSLRKK